MKFLQALFRPFAVLLLLLGSLFLTACSIPGHTTPNAEANRAKLGTQWGEDLESRSTNLQLKRINEKPFAVQMLRYSATALGGERRTELPLANERVELRVLKENGGVWPIYRKGGVEQLKGKSGERYRLEYRNNTRTKTYEIVTTVDGLDVLNGQAGSVKNRGYVLRPGGVLRIEGFRKSRNEVAAFRFSSAADSYAANSDAESAANVGVIGTAIFELADPVSVKPQEGSSACVQKPCAFPKDRDPAQGGYAAPPKYE